MSSIFNKIVQFINTRRRFDWSIMGVFIIILIIGISIYKNITTIKHKFYVSNTSAEIIHAPDYDIYGGRINIWVYRDMKGNIIQCNESGHAPSSICKLVSMQFMGTILELKQESENIIVPGALSIVIKDPIDNRKQIIMNRMVREFREIEKNYGFMKINEVSYNNYLKMIEKIKIDMNTLNTQINLIDFIGD